MKYTGETAVKLAERYGLPIQKEADESEGARDDLPLEDAQWILNHGDPETIFVNAEPELAEAVKDEKTGLPNR